MSALVAWGVPETGRPAPRLPRRVPLRAPDHGSRGNAVALPPSWTTVRRLRLTARGRLVRTLVVFGVVSLLALMRWVPVVDANALTVGHHTVVRPGQTLTQVAQEQLPQLPVGEAVSRLRRLNRLAAPEVSTGQSLAIPVAR